MKSTDTEYEDHVITEVTESETHYSVMMGPMGFGISKEYGIRPKTGDTIRLYGTFGRPIRGVDLNGVELYYRTPDEEAERHRLWVEQKHQDDRAKFEEEREKLDVQYDALPPIFRKRIDKFRRNNPDFRWQFERYEMFCCREAVKIAEALETPERVEAFRQMGWEEQKELVDLDADHSGNTFGAACALAYHYLSDAENVEKMHGALAPLVGSKEYGCVPRDTID